ncbi:F-box domain containing protein [Trema orientale]|uniref:F-box domain containing protein n=1 Tax=Trema orientale TaxID=63057 RepID=A0A2P5BIC5_TREOI|nr:F-box domain containing protein [Trema orientale]
MDHPPSNSHLPEPVIHKILRLLPPQDAIRASATSKLWRSAWISHPVFDFDEASLPFKLDAFYDFANRSLALWLNRCDNRVNMEKLSLCADVTNGESFSRFVELVAIATSRNVKVIELQTCSEFYYLIFHNSHLWSLLSACKSLDVLSLKHFKFYLSSSLPPFSSVRKLRLSGISIDENSVRNLLSSFPSLEDLVVECCSGFDELRVSCPKLETMEVSIWDDPPQKVVIDSANLRSFFYRKAFRCALGSVSFSSCKLLTTLAMECTEFGTVNAIDEYLSQIPLLENLTLKSCKTPESIQISHSNLKSLKLQNLLAVVEGGD